MVAQLCLTCAQTRRGISRPGPRASLHGGKNFELWNVNIRQQQVSMIPGLYDTRIEEIVLLRSSNKFDQERVICYFRVNKER